MSRVDWLVLILLVFSLIGLLLYPPGSTTNRSGTTSIGLDWIWLHESVFIGTVLAEWLGIVGLGIAYFYLSRRITKRAERFIIAFVVLCVVGWLLVYHVLGWYRSWLVYWLGYGFIGMAGMAYFYFTRRITKRAERFIIASVVLCMVGLLFYQERGGSLSWLLFEWVGVIGLGLGYLYLARRIGTGERLGELFAIERMGTIQKLILAISVVTMVGLFFYPPGNRGHDWMWGYWMYQHEVYVWLLIFEWAVVAALCTGGLYLTNSSRDDRKEV